MLVNKITHMQRRKKMSESESESVSFSFFASLYCGHKTKSRQVIAADY